MNFTTPVTDYGGFELALGSVFAVRWFRVDRYGRLRAVNYDFTWRPGENIAKCQRDEDSLYGTVYRSMARAFSFSVNNVVMAFEPDENESLSNPAVEARLEVKHLVPMDSCGCGFYAFAQGCDDGGYTTEPGVRGIIECYGRTVLGTRGLRCEKARIVALTTDRADIRRNYPDVRFFSPPRKLRFRRDRPKFAQMLAAFDLVQPYTPTPDDPDFWERP